MVGGPLKRQTGTRCDGRTRGGHVDGRAKWERRAARPKRQRQAASECGGRRVSAAVLIL